MKNGLLYLLLGVLVVSCADPVKKRDEKIESALHKYGSRFYNEEIKLDGIKIIKVDSITEKRVYGNLLFFLKSEERINSNSYRIFNESYISDSTYNETLGHIEYDDLAKPLLDARNLRDQYKKKLDSIATQIDSINKIYSVADSMSLYFFRVEFRIYNSIRQKKDTLRQIVFIDKNFTVDTIFNIARFDWY